MYARVFFVKQIQVVGDSYLAFLYALHATVVCPQTPFIRDRSSSAHLNEVTCSGLIAAGTYNAVF